MRATDPSDRNYEIFCDVEFASVSLRKAAEKYQLSPTRIQQIVEQVRQWFRATSVSWEVEGSPIGTAMLAMRVCEERLRYLNTLTMEAFVASQAEITVRREFPGRANAAVVTTTRSFGEALYLREAVRITQASHAASCRHALLLQRLQNNDNTFEHAPPVEVCAREEETFVEEQQPDSPTSVPSPMPQPVYESSSAPITSFDVPFPALATPVRSRLDRKLARHDKRKAARERKRARQTA